MTGVIGLDVYSTFARDILIDASTNERREQPGGPALFVRNALERAGASFVMHAGPVVDVEILITKTGEFGNVQSTPSPETVPVCESRRALVSTLFQEWDPEVIAAGCDEMFLDVQGFVRSAGSFGKKQTWDRFDGEWIRKILVLKATEEELQYLPTRSVEDQKRRVLLITKGKAGGTAYVGGDVFEFVPPRIVTFKNTLGAGDTFLATVVEHLIRGVTVDRAVSAGMEATIRLLEASV